MHDIVLNMYVYPHQTLIHIYMYIALINLKPIQDREITVAFLS